MKTTNEELLTARDLRRELGRRLTQLDDGTVDKLVLMKGTDMAYVVLPVKTYEQLEGESRANDRGHQTHCGPRDPGQEQRWP